METLTKPGLNLEVHDAGKFFAELFKGEKKKKYYNQISELKSS